MYLGSSRSSSIISLYGNTDYRQSLSGIEATPPSTLHLTIVAAVHTLRVHRVLSMSTVVEDTPTHTCVAVLPYKGKVQ